MRFSYHFYWLIGIVFLFLAKGKHLLKGYSSPKPFEISDSKRCIAYDIKVVDEWLHYLKKYSNTVNPLKNKQILELGPGSDLGTGLYLLSLGCEKYTAIDSNYLIKNTSMEFYYDFLNELNNKNNRADIAYLKEQIINTNNGKESLISYFVSKDFNFLNAIEPATIDLVFSQAAFEHFDKIEETVNQLNVVCKPGAILIAEIDLRTHSRWIRGKDPNNIYRYSKWIYNLLSFKGIPNRIRPYQYKKIFIGLGWKDVEVIPLTRVKNRALCSGLNEQFSDLSNQMELLSVMLCARKN